MKNMLEEVPTLEPTFKEFNNPIEYLSQPHIKRLGFKYGVLKLKPPDIFDYRLNINTRVLKFKPRLQTLCHLNLKNRARWLFIKQLNNFNSAYGMNERKKLKFDRPFIDIEKNKRLYFYDLFIELLKRINNIPNYTADENNNNFTRSKRFKNSNSNKRIINNNKKSDSIFSNLFLLSWSKIDDVNNKKLWNHLMTHFNIDKKILYDFFVNYIKDYYIYIYESNPLHELSSPTFIDEYPKSLLSDDEYDDFEEPLESDSENDFEQEKISCIICKQISNKSNLIQCISCDKSFHIQCLSSPPPSSQFQNFICKHCIMGNGYYGFKIDPHLYSISEFKISCPEINEENSVESLEEHFWSIVNNPLSQKRVKYGADIPYPNSIKPVAEENNYPMNLLNLPKNSNSLLKYFPKSISGMTVPWFYIGSKFSTFCWHMEDQYTLSANYQHEGDPKIWYCIPPQYYKRFQDMMYSLTPDLFSKQHDLLHQLISMVSPYDSKLFEQFNVKVYKAVQRPKEFIITFPQCYHSGFNSGFNLNEAVNFTTDFWIEYGIQAIEDYKYTGKKCVFDMYELLINILKDFLLMDKKRCKANISLFRDSFEELLTFLNSQKRLIKSIEKCRDIEKIELYSEIKREECTGDININNDEEDSELYCQCCSTICSIACIVITTNSIPRTIFSPDDLKRYINKGSTGEVLCLTDYVTRLPILGTIKHATLYLLKDTEQINSILRLSGNKLDTIGI